MGGAREENEKPIETAKRELLEETGLESDNFELIKTYEWKGKTIWTVYIFVARNCKKITNSSLDSGERIEIKEVNFNDFISIVSSASFGNKEISNDIYRMKDNKLELEKFRNKLFGIN